MNHAAAGELHGFVHVDAQVLHRLERADRLAELAPHFGIFDDEVQHCSRRPKRVSGPGDDHVIDQRLDDISGPDRQALSGCVVKTDTKTLARLVNPGLQRAVDLGR